MFDPAMPTQGIYVSVDELLQLRHLAQNLTLKTRKRSQALMQGPVITRYRGRGMEFAEVRPYQAGDDIRTIDWRVTARMQAPYTKLFQEERERPVLLIVDQRSPMFFGSQVCFKSVMAARIAAVLAWIARRNKDRLGALIIGDQQQQDIRTKSGNHSALEFIHQLARLNAALTSPIPQPQGLSLETALKEACRVAKPGGMVVIISDFNDYSDACRESLNRLSKHSDLLAIEVFDPLERDLPQAARLTVSNGQNRMTLNLKQLQKSYFDDVQKNHQKFQEDCLLSGVQYTQLKTTTDLASWARHLFSNRTKAS